METRGVFGRILLVHGVSTAVYVSGLFEVVVVGCFEGGTRVNAATSESPVEVIWGQLFCQMQCGVEGSVWN